MAGLTRRHAREETPHKAHAFTVEQLHQVHAHLRDDSRPRAVRDRALIAVGIAAALRASSISELKLKDVNRTRTYDGLLLRVRFSKTDQTANGVDIPVKAAPSSRICPVKALDAWLSVLEAQGITREANPEFPLFPVMRGEQVKHTEMKHPAVSITKLLRDTLVSAQIVSRTGSEAFSSHSLRSTFITLSSQKSIPAERIARVSQHQSLSILRGYDRTEIEAFGQAEYLA
nr:MULTISPECIES: tyrosine-type recombinase/integrase [unclassified Leucobacter]